TSLAYGKEASSLMSWVTTAIVLASLSSAQAAAGMAPQFFEISSDVLCRDLVVENGVLRTAQIRNLTTGQTLLPDDDSGRPDDSRSPSKEFEIQLSGGRALSTKDYRVTAHKTSRN